MAFDILIGGVGDAFSLQHYGTHFVLRHDDFVLAIDCPDHFRRALSEHPFSPDEKPLDVDDLDALHLTHLHGDHVNGLEMTLAYRAMALNQPPLPLYGIAEVVDDLWPRRLEISLGRAYDGQDWSTIDRQRYFDLHRLSVDETNRLGPFEIELRLTKHHLPTTAMRISDGEVTMAYSCDTAFDVDLIDWLAEDSDIIFHECTFGAAHTQLFDLQKLDESIRNKLVLVHYSDQLIGMDTGDLQMARQGQVVELGR